MLTFQILDDGETFYRPLDHRPLTIGSGPDADIRLAEPGVDALHARVEPVTGSGRDWAFKIVDLDSGTGTRVNGEQVVQVKLALGDRVEIGSAVLVLGRKVRRPATAEDVLETPVARIARRPRERRPARRSPVWIVAGVVAAVAVVGGGLWFGPGADRPPIAYAEQAKLRALGQFDQARALLGRIRTEWAAGRSERLAIVDRAAARLEATESAVAELSGTISERAPTTTYAEQFDWMKAIEREQPDSARAEAAHILYGKLEEMRRVALAERGRVRPSNVLVEQRPPQPSEVESAVVPTEDEGGAGVPKVLESVEQALAEGQHGQALEMLREALAATPVARAGALRDRLAAERLAARQAIEGVLGESRKRVKAGDLNGAIALLREQAPRFPHSGQLAALTHELEGLEQERTAREATALARAGTVERGANPAAPDDPAAARRHRQTLDTIAGLMDSVRKAEREGDFDGAGSLLRQAASQVEERDAVFAHRLRGKADDLRYLSALGELAARIPAECGVTVALRDGRQGDVLGVDGNGLRVQAASGSRTLGWADLPASSVRDLVAALKGPPTAWLGAGVLAFRNGERELADDCLARALAADHSLQEAIDGVIRRGRVDRPDPKGYRLVKGRFVGVSELEADKLSRRFEREVATALRGDDKARRAFVEGILSRGPEALDALILALERQQAALGERLATNPFKARVFDKLAGLRQRLDAARTYAKDLIFDEVKYFYPYRPPAVDGKKAAEYWPVQQEVDARVAALRELWNKKQPRARVPHKLIEDADHFRWLTRILGEFAQRHPEVEKKAAWVDALPDVRELDIRTFCRNAEERRDFELWQRIEQFNAKMAEQLSTAEQRQVAITNAYRRMFGHRPLAINPKVVEAARGHSSEMSKLGYFGHFSPTPGRRTPFDRMRLAGYKMGVSENCAINGSAEGAHVAWIHSSGHHRNLLAPTHKEFGVGNAGRYWTQNFGTGEEFLKNPAFPKAAAR